MITRIEASGYRCLRDVSQNLEPYQILVGPNGSGKTAFLDAIAFVADTVGGGLRYAVGERTENFHDLVWGRDGSSFRLAVEAVRVDGSDSANVSQTPVIRYEFEVRLAANEDEVLISSEQLLLLSGSAREPRQVAIREGRRVRFQAENTNEGFEFELPPHLSALANLPMDETRFPSAVWFKGAFDEGVKTVALDGELLRAPAPPGRARSGFYDGLNLARLVQQLQDTSPRDFQAWISHVQTAIPDIVEIKTVLRPEDKYRYLSIRYDNGFEIPSWMVSDGTLRLLALTLLAYEPTGQRAYLVEEPEIGIHPTAVETVMQSLSSVYGGQVLITSHSPLVLSMPQPRELLCFQRTKDGTTIVRGDEHPLLKEWKSQVNIADLFASGVLG